jgi:2',3'-cyclic-nucleotide 2'-phosphodiesterase (5'-nucleotidase family)
LKNHTRFILLAFILSLSTTSCAVVERLFPPDYNIEYSFRDTDENRYNITSELAEDSLVLGMIRPYQVELSTRMKRVIGEAETTFSNVRPDGSLGNLAADMIRRTASQELGLAVDIGLMNWGGLRVPINKGSITVGDIYTVMPFDNWLVVLTFKGSQIREIANQLASMGGQPISGLRMRIENGKANDILIGTRPLEDDLEYTLATNNFLADGGDRITSLLNPLQRQDIQVYLRDAMIRYITERYSITPTNDQRLR